VKQITVYGLLFTLLLTACAAPVAQSLTLNPSATCTMPNSQPTRFLALGDSYTIGEAVLESERWPVQLAARLQASGVPIEPPQIIATTGWTTDELSAGIDRVNPQGPFELVSLLIGVNNQYRGRSLEEYRTQFVALLERAVKYAGDEPQRVLVLSIPDWGVTPFANPAERERIAKEIDAFNAVNGEEAERMGARYVDVTPTSRRAADEPNLIAGDGLHPSGLMYAAWAELAFSQACAALEK
jgi:lysophospholipase L1-like esterase